MEVICDYNSRHMYVRTGAHSQCCVGPTVCDDGVRWFPLSALAAAAVGPRFNDVFMRELF